MKTFAFQLAALTLFLGAVSGHTQVITSDPSLPTLFPAGQYVTAQDVFSSYHGPGLTIVLSMAPLRDFGPVGRSGSGANELEQFNSTLNGSISVNGSPNQPMNASGPTFDEVFGKIGNTTGTFNTEMLSLDLSGTSPFGPFMIRESPTLASTGQTSVSDLGGGLYQIDSFFDIFTELSLDGGNSWIPSDGSSHVTLEPTPEPSAAALLLLGGCGLAVGRNQRRAVRG